MLKPMSSYSVAGASHFSVPIPLLPSIVHASMLKRCSISFLAGRRYTLLFGRLAMLEAAIHVLTRTQSDGLRISDPAGIEKDQNEEMIAFQLAIGASGKHCAKPAQTGTAPFIINVHVFLCNSMRCCEMYCNAFEWSAHAIAVVRKAACKPVSPLESRTGRWGGSIGGLQVRFAMLGRTAKVWFPPCPCWTGCHKLPLHVARTHALPPV